MVDALETACLYNRIMDSLPQKWLQILKCTEINSGIITQFKVKS